MNYKEKIKTIIVEKPLKLDCGKTISNFPIAYETYGSLNENKDNAILIFSLIFIIKLKFELWEKKLF